MVVAALIMATGALAVALIDGRVPVFEIVVSSTPLFTLPLMQLTAVVMGPHCNMLKSSQVRGCSPILTCGLRGRILHPAADDSERWKLDADNVSCEGEDMGFLFGHEAPVANSCHARVCWCSQYDTLL